jgi:hypothetical protein
VDIVANHEMMRRLIRECNIKLQEINKYQSAFIYRDITLKFIFRMVKFIDMNAANSQVLPAPPNLIRALLAGFDTVANHIGLIIFSISLDFFLWFGPQVHLLQLFRSYLDWTIQATQEQTPQLLEAMRSSVEILRPIVERFNLTSLLRTFPVGVPSLMAGRAPLANPFGKPAGWDVASFGIVVVGLLVIVMVGMLVGVLYFSLTAQAALLGKVSWKAALETWLWRYSQILLLSIFWVALLFAISIPLSCVFPLLLVGGGNAGRLAIFMYGALLIWLLFPLVFSPFGIFVHQDAMWASVLRGARVARFTMSGTLLFALVLVILSQGMDLLWNIPAETSWFAVVGVVGHAFIAASLLAAIFIYYRDAGAYVQQRLQLAKT